MEHDITHPQASRIGRMHRKQLSRLADQRIHYHTLNTFTPIYSNAEESDGGASRNVAHFEIVATTQDYSAQSDRGQQGTIDNDASYPSHYSHEKRL
jgi:hypothetical protein